MHLSRFEFNLYKKIKQIEKRLKFKNQTILLNLQISGGLDSMCLLNAIHSILNSNKAIFDNSYNVIIQHFNHKQRGEESDEDSYFVAQECVKKGYPVYLSSLQNPPLNTNFQNYFRNWRKQEAIKLCELLKNENNYAHYFVLTAHHARDHVETIILNILRGSGINGLKGIQLLDDKNIYLRPFYKTKHDEIIEYKEEKNILFREDSSNFKENYNRNYIRKHILPHLKIIQNNYELAFVKLSENIIQSKDNIENKLYEFVKENGIQKDISKNSIQNIIHESQLLLNSNEITKEVLLKKKKKCLIYKENNEINYKILDIKVLE